MRASERACVRVYARAMCGLSKSSRWTRRGRRDRTAMSCLHAKQLFTRRLHAVYTLFTRCLHAVYTLCARCLPAVYPLFTRCLHAVYTLFTRCLHAVYGVFIRCLHSDLCTTDVHEDVPAVLPTRGRLFTRIVPFRVRAETARPCERAQHNVARRCKRSERASDLCE